MGADLTGVDLKIKWAEKKIKWFEERIPGLRNTKGYEIVVQDDPDRPGRLCKVLKINEPAATEMLIEVALRAGDIIHVLRSSLDHFAYVIARKSDTTAFPIWRKPQRPSATQYESLIASKLPGISKPIRDLFLSMEPYEGGNHEPLWALDYLDIVDKHRLILDTFGASVGLSINFALYTRLIYNLSEEQMPDQFATWSLNEPRYPLSGDEILTANLDEESQHYMDPVVHVVFGEPKSLEGEPILPTLAQLAQTVAQAIDQFRSIV